MGELHAKFEKNWWSGFRDIALHDTQGHSFIIIRINQQSENSTDIQHRPITNIEDKSRMIKVQDMYSYFRVQIFDDVEVSPSFQEMLRRMIAIKDQSWY